MSNVARTILIPASLTPLARALAAGLSSAGAGMFTTALAAISAPTTPTYYISSGLIDASFAGLLHDAGLLYAACQAAKPPASVTLAQCQALVAQSVVSDGTTTVLIDGVSTVVNEGPHELIARLGLKINQAAS